MKVETVAIAGLCGEGEIGQAAEQNRQYGFDLEAR
jgi:small ligand-binding sensory domain FIST